MLLQIFRLLKAIPVTWLLLFFSGLLWAVDVALSQRLQVPFSVAQEILGAQTRPKLWDGAWWTVITTAFHHGGALHLLCNALFLWGAGRLLETRMGSWRYALFSLSGLIVSGAIQSMWGPSGGLSGMLCAQFGLIWAWRKTDPWLQTYVPQENITWILAWLLICLPITWLGLIRIANVAHFSGLFYGYIAGQVYFGTPRVRLWKPVFLVAHACLIPLFYFLVHPVWDGNYHWHRGNMAVNSVERQKHYENAVRWDPTLEGPWLNLAILAEHEGRFQEAWDWTMGCLLYHPSYQPAINMARRLWSRFPDHERAAARFKLRQIFGDTAPIWEERLLADVQLDDLAPQKRRIKSVPEIRDMGEAIEEPLEGPELSPFTLPRRALDEIPKPAGKLPAPNPEIPGSAEEGRAA